MCLLKMLNDIIDKIKNCTYWVCKMIEKKIKNLISPAKLGEALGLSRSTVCRHTDAGVMPHYKLGVNRLYDLEEVKEHLKMSIK